MKKIAVIALSFLLPLCFAGCAQPPAPEQAADGAAWSGGWVTVGNVIGVDTPEGLTPRENNTALDIKGMYYATWSVGEETAYVNDSGDDAKVYDAQFYLLLAGYDAAAKAEVALAEWQSLAVSQYAVEETSEAVYNGQPFTVITYTYNAETNPYQRGASAFGIYRNYAVNVEISCLENFDGNAQEILADFLENCHYAV